MGRYLPDPLDPTVEDFIDIDCNGHKGDRIDIFNGVETTPLMICEVEVFFENGESSHSANDLELEIGNVEELLIPPARKFMILNLTIFSRILISILFLVLF